MKTAHKIGLARAAYRAIHFGRTIIGQSDRCVVTRAGLNYDLDLSQGIDFAIYLGIFERSTRKALRKLVEPSALVLDIGANIYVFRGRRGDLIKIIWHDGQGACLFTKRLERGRFLWPSLADGVVTISVAQLSYLLSGIDWRMPQATWRRQASG